MSHTRSGNVAEKVRYTKTFERNLFFLYKHFRFEVTFVQTCIAIDSPVRH